MMMMMGIEFAEWEDQLKCFRDGLKVAPVRPSTILKCQQ